MLGCDNILQIYGYRTLVPEDYVEYFHRVCASSQLESCSKCPHFVPPQMCYFGIYSFIVLIYLYLGVIFDPGMYT